MIWKCSCAYDGTDFNGWQSQPCGNTVQDFIEARLKVIFKKPVRIHGSGRTDSGVHARGQVFHFEAEWEHPAENLLRAFKCGLPAGIQVTDVKLAKPDFHARFSAQGKRYCYRIFEGTALPDAWRYCWSLDRRRLNTEVMQEAANHLIGQHDFTGFAALRGDGSEDNPVKDMRRLDVLREGAEIRIVTEASGYLYKMVRSITGTLVEVGMGNLTPEAVREVLVSKKRIQRVNTAPAKGLWLEEVFYEPA